MKILMTGAAALVFATAAAPAVAQQSDATDVLLKALKSVGSAATPPGQNKRPADPDQGDDNAALRAITEVCNKGTPAADRSAICRRTPVSPQ